jgi:methyl-accepting chemotaxis protein
MGAAEEMGMKMKTGRSSLREAAARLRKAVEDARRDMGLLNIGVSVLARTTADLATRTEALQASFDVVADALADLGVTVEDHEERIAALEKRKGAA